MATKATKANKATKVCIIAHTERNYLPYMDRYTTFFDENNVEYDIICWQREESLFPCPENEFHFFEEAEEGFFKKLGSYLRYRRYVLKILKKKKYDKLIVLTTVPAVFIYRYMLNKYDGNYLFDIRDYSFESFAPYRKLVNRIIEHSAITTISSHGFMEFLAPNKKIVMNHNIPIQFTPAKEARDIKGKQVLNIGFIGGVRYFDENCALMEKLKNTFRYQLWYIGKPVPDCDLQGYCAEHEITNVSFVGKYNNADKAELYKNIDMINSIYGDESLEVTTALPNRLYEACLLKKPIISSTGTFLGELIDRYDIGISVDVEADDVLAIVDHYVENFDPVKFSKHCDEFLNDVKKDEENLYRQLKSFIKERSKKAKKEKAQIVETESPEQSKEAPEPQEATKEAGVTEEEKINEIKATEAEAGVEIEAGAETEAEVGIEVGVEAETEIEAEIEKEVADNSEQVTEPRV